MNISYSLFRNIGIHIITVNKYQACHLVHFEDFSISTEFLYPNLYSKHLPFPLYSSEFKPVLHKQKFTNFFYFSQVVKMLE